MVLGGNLEDASIQVKESNQTGGDQDSRDQSMSHLVFLLRLRREYLCTRGGLGTRPSTGGGNRDPWSFPLVTSLTSGQRQKPEAKTKCIKI